jgi:phospholipase/carboxylesterase
MTNIPPFPLPTLFQDSLWVSQTHPNYPATELIHYVRQPKQPTGKAVVLIHGWGGNESVMWAFAHTIPSDTTIISPRAPFSHPDGNIWFTVDEAHQRRPISSSVQTGLLHLQKFYNALPDLYGIDPRQTVVVGFSQGAAMSSLLLLSQPETVAAVALLAGFIPLPQAQLPTNDLTDKPVFIAHGTRDETVPLAASHRAKVILASRGAQVQANEYTVGHKMTSQALRDLSAWLAARW